MLKTWWAKNKVFVFGGIAAIIEAVVAFTSQETINWVLVGMAALTALAGYLGRTLRGQVGSIVGIIFTLILGILPSLISKTPVDWEHQLLWTLGQIGALFFGLTAPPAKTIGYERTETIKDAKEEGKDITKTTLNTK